MQESVGKLGNLTLTCVNAMGEFLKDGET